MANCALLISANHKDPAGMRGLSVAIVFEETFRHPID
jgi:hypothetical protein